MGEKLQGKLLDSGIIPSNAVRQMEQWQTVPKGSADKVGEFTSEKIDALKEELEIQTLPTLKETILDVDKIVAAGRPVYLRHNSFVVNGIMAGVDVLRRYIFEIPKGRGAYNTLSMVMRPSTVLVDESLQPPQHRRVITEVSVLYATVKEGESVPTHWFCVTEADGEGSILRAR